MKILLEFGDSTRRWMAAPAVQLGEVRVDFSARRSMMSDEVSYQVSASVGEPDRDRCGNDIGGETFRGDGPSPAAALARLLGQSASRRAAGRLRQVRDALRGVEVEVSAPDADQLVS